MNIEQIVYDLLDETTPLESVLERAKAATLAHFAADLGTPKNHYWRMQLYAPIYVSSYCVNQCLYCGFRAPCAIKRRHLTVDETLAESRYLLRRGFKSQLIVAGENPRVSSSYLAEIMRGLRDMGAVPSIEVAPLSVEAYAETVEAGCHGITLFQETFDRELYTKYHPTGPKSDYNWRVNAIERAAQAGMPRLGYGVLLGLAEPKRELLEMIRQAQAIQDKYPDRTIAFSLPRIHEGPNAFQIPFLVSDELFVRMYCALRILFPKSELVLSTREKAELRNRLASTCITQMSAESSTEPGGYSLSDQATPPPQTDEQSPTFHGQFQTTDNRSVEEVADWLKQNGHHVQW